VQCFDFDLFVDLEGHEFFADGKVSRPFEGCFYGVVSDQAIVYH
jgi:hypothetical protein